MRRGNNVKILLVAGGSGGHIFPAIALSEQLSKGRQIEIIFVASKRALDKNILKDKPFKKVFLSINPMPYGLSFKIVPFLIKFIYDFFASIFL